MQLLQFEYCIWPCWEFNNILINCAALVSSQLLFLATKFLATKLNNRNAQYKVMTPQMSSLDVYKEKESILPYTAVVKHCGQMWQVPVSCSFE